MIEPGDVIEFRNRSAGKRKFHVCVCIGKVDGIYKFLMINSKSGFKSDVVFQDGVINGLPTSPTGKTVVSLSQIHRIKSEKFPIWQPKAISVIPKHVVIEIRKHALEMKSLTKSDREWLISKLDDILRCR